MSAPPSTDHALPPHKTIAWHILTITMLLIILLLWCPLISHTYSGFGLMGAIYSTIGLARVVSSLLDVLCGKRIISTLRFGEQQSAKQYRALTITSALVAVILIPLWLGIMSVVIARVLPVPNLIACVILFNIHGWFGLIWVREIKAIIKTYNRHKAAERIAAPVPQPSIMTKLSPFTPTSLGTSVPQAKSPLPLLAGRKVVP